MTKPTLYFAPRTRATRPRWLLEEMGVSYELKRLDWGRREHKDEAYLAIHPHGAVPALVDGDVTLIESGAICAYLAEKHPEAGMAPPVGASDRGRYLQWMFYATATLEPPGMRYLLHTSIFPPERRSPQIAAQSLAEFQGTARVLSKALETSSFLLGDRLTVPDVLVGSMLSYGSSLGMLSSWPRLAAYVEDLTARPAFKRAQD